MSQNHIQTSFHSGEWAPALNARVDLAKYHSAAALLENFFVDYRGGASTRMGTKYVLLTWNPRLRVRLIPFQASFTVSYVLEFGAGYIRFINNGSMVLESPINITGATRANPCVITAANAYVGTQWVFIQSVNGMTQLNGKYFSVGATTGGTFALQDLLGNNLNSTGYGAYISGGTAQRVYLITSPYASADLALLKYAQQGNTLIITHPNYPPYILTLNSATNWTLSPINFTPTISAPTSPSSATTLASGTVNYSYCVTAVDINGQESSPSAITSLSSKQDLRAVGGTNTIGWAASTGAVSYNVYKAELSYGASVPSGAAFGYIGNATGVAFIDSNISPDYSLTPPITRNPFAGAGVSGINITNGGSYVVVPNITIAGPGGGGVTAQAQAVMQTFNVALVFGGNNYHIGDIIALANGVTITVTLVSGSRIQTFVVNSFGGTTTTISPNPVSQSFTSGSGTGATFNLTWTIVSAILSNPGSGYGGAPAVSFSPASTAAATATIGASSAGNPGVPAFSQQRLVLAAPPGAVNTIYGSGTGAFFNYDVSNPLQADDAYTFSIVDNQLNTIKSMVNMQSGLLVLTDKGVWQINGGTAGSPITPIDAIANPQSRVGASDVPPIIANQEILYVQSKGSIVRDLTYNFYANIYTGTDVSILSSHLFFGYQINEWAWAEEPFKIVWAVRNDGVLLSLTFLKEQELIGWSHHVTQGTFQSVATVTETVNGNSVDAVYVIVTRTVGGQVLQYIERMADRYFSSYINPWCVDSALQYNGTAATVFSGLDHLIGLTVTGLADGNIIPPQVVAADGSITLATPATLVTVGLSYTAKLQTLALDLGEPTVQGKFKKIAQVTVRVNQTLGLSIGSTFDTLVSMKDLIIGNIGQNTNEWVTDLVTADATTVIDPSYTEPGQYCIQQSQPYPASILGVIPEFVIGDTAK